ncbi:hypothetical protein EGW08_015410, partial [Elysia chlorotica]
MTGTASYLPIHGLEALETGLHTLHKSRLQTIPEFKGMCDAINRHYTDLKLAHLTGKAKDLQDQAVRDTKFYNILTKMLCEIEGKQEGQRKNLQRVYTWYMANKHVLYCGPHFGRETIKKEAKEIFRKATTPRKPSARKLIRAKSAVERSTVSQRMSTRFLRCTTSTPRHPTHPKLSFRGDPPPSFRLDLDYLADVEPYNGPVTIDHDGAELSPGLADEEESDEGPVDHSASPSPPRVLSRPKTAASSKLFSGRDLRNRSAEITTPRTLQRMVHPIPCYVNPHTALAKECSPVEPGTSDPPKIVSARSLPRDNLAAWQNFYKDRGYGQDLKGNLKFAGRSGTASDVRYTAHSYGESPELHTGAVLKHISGNVSSPHISNPNEPVDEESAFMQQTLEEFYQRADAILAATTKHGPKMSATNRAKSAPVKGKITGSVSQLSRLNTVTPVAKSAHQSTCAMEERAEETTESNIPKDTGVRLNTVINIIDSVSEDMVFFKEKVAPEPQAGFRQPSTTGLPTPREVEGYPAELDLTDNGPCPVSTPKLEEINEMAPENSYISSPFASRTLKVRENVTDDAGGIKKGRCKSAGLLDWRGRIQPDTVRYKWSKTKFGGHTYLKKWNRPNLRSAGSTTGRKRPKTAPSTVKERWKTEKESDRNERVVQAASHDVKLVDQNDVDAMFSVHHLLGDGDRTNSLDSLFEMDEAFWRNLRKNRPTPRDNPPTMEFLSFITPSGAALAEQRSKLLSALPGEQGQDTDRLDRNEQLATSEVAASVTPIQVPDSNYDVDALNAAVNEELQSLDHTGEVCYTGRQSSQEDRQSLVKSETVEQPRSHIAVRSVPPSGPRPPTASERCQPLQDLSPSEEWRFSLEEELLNFKGDSKKTDHFCDVQLDSTIPGIDNRDSMTTKVQRSAGRMPSQSHTAASSHMLAYSRRYSDAMRRAPPLRTPPSIPTPQPSARRLTSRSGGGPVLAELERHARRSKSPRNLMNTVNTLRSEDYRPESEVSQISQDPFIGMTLQVCRLPTSSRGRWSQVSAENDFDFNEQLLQSPSNQPNHPQFMSREPSLLHSINESQDYAGTGQRVSIYSQRRTSGQTLRKPTTAPSLEWARSQTGKSEDLGLYRNSTWTSIGSRPNQTRQGMSIDPRTMIVGRPYSKAGRPIAQVSKIPDPDELYDAVVKQKEASAAVDIQRIFRGYVARGVYKNLLSEEIKRKEDERRAAIKIQSIYRGHISRKQAIYNRPPLNPDLIKWSKDVKAIQNEHSQKRQVKMDALANEISENHRVAAQKISVIGPHVEVYDIYHPKKTGPTKRELNQAAIKIQKLVRGWMIRRKMEKLSRKAVWYGSSFQKMVKEYKTMLKRVQQQHDVDKASTPFSISDMNSYIDTRRRYESVFEKKSFGGELEHGDIEAFFRECDLYPSQAEVEEAMDVTMRGQSKRESKGLKKKELMDMIFYIYTPSATGLKGTRQSTWMSPIIEGQEARKLLGSEFVEPAPLAPCAKLVIDTKREQRLKEQAQKEAEEKRRINKEK